MRQIDKRTRLTRRRFLQTSTATAVGALATGSVLIDPRGAWAMTLTTLQPDTAKTLIQAARDLYPHDQLAE
ncbi:MAG: twin-arginine translocation signal domain-containing protein, partial [Alphaproteobacteria bacterium]|nr:twin-arginine translocation signal domain-containing protein [Alphaproteobacteria bacterium]